MGLSVLAKDVTGDTTTVSDRNALALCPSASEAMTDPPTPDLEHKVPSHRWSATGDERGDLAVGHEEVVALFEGRHTNDGLAGVDAGEMCISHATSVDPLARSSQRLN